MDLRICCYTSYYGSGSTLFVVDKDGDGVGALDDAFPIDHAASVDTDGDGMPDAWNDGYDETDSTTGLTLDPYPNETPAEQDVDNDGLLDVDEATHGTDLNNPDTDGDGLTDGLELTMGMTDPLNADSNNNGCPDGEEALGGCGDACVGDLNLNGTVDVGDVLLLLSNFGITCL